MAKEIEIMKAYCPISKKYYIFSIVNGKAVDFIPVDKQRYDLLNTTSSASETARNLLPNRFEQSRQIASSDRVQRHFNDCSYQKRYNFQCAYCKNLILDRGDLAKSLEDCTIAVTSSGFDDVGAVLNDMRVKYRNYQSITSEDIVFVNCGTADYVDPQALRSFVQRGGVAYLSDWAIKPLQEAFPEMVRSYSQDTDEMRVMARVEDQEIASVIGSHIEVYFDLGSWVKIESCDATVILSAVIHNRRTPIMIMRKYGKGTVFYTSFHNHASASQKEKDLLKLLICKQLGTKLGKKVNDISALLGLNIKM